MHPANRSPPQKLNELVVEESDSEDTDEEQDRAVYDHLAATENYVPFSVRHVQSSSNLTNLMKSP